MKNFTISLYAFHLRHTFTDPPDSVTDGADNLWENLAQLGEGSLPFPELKNLRQKLICYENGTYEPAREKGRQTDWLTDSGCLELGSIPTTEGFRIKANIQPFRLNDTYAAEFMLSPELRDTEIDLPQLQLFKPSCLLPSNIQASLGQTLWIYGEVDKSDEDCQTLAQNLANALVAGTSLNPVLVTEDKLLGSLLFEYQATNYDDPLNITNNCHIIIWLNNHQFPTVDLAGKAYNWLLNLLCCRHKIFYIYQQARDRNPEARTLYSALEKDIKDFATTIADPTTRLEKLQKLLAKIPNESLRFSRCIRDLQAHKIALATNAKNYRICLEKITKIGDSPQYWENFLNRICNQWESQIQIDIDYLSPGQTLFEQMINTIRGTVEIEQAKCDRDAQIREKENDLELQIVIASVGVGIGVAGVTATAFPYYLKPADKPEKIKIPGNFSLPQNIKIPDNFSPHPITQSIIISLGIGLLASIVPWVLFYIWGRRRGKFRKKSKQLSSKQLPQQKQATLSTSSSSEMPAPIQQAPKVPEPVPANSDKT